MQGVGRHGSRQADVALHVGRQLRLVAGQAVQRQIALQGILNSGRQHLQCLESVHLHVQRLPP